MTNLELLAKHQFQFSAEMDGQKFDIKFLPNKTPQGQHIYDLVTGIGIMGRKTRRYLSYALVNGELKAFIYTPMVYRLIDPVKLGMFIPFHSVGLTAIGGSRETVVENKVIKLSCPDIKIVSDDKFILTKDTFPYEAMKEFDLDDIYAGMKEKYKDVPSGIEGKTLGDIWGTALGS